MAIVEDEMRNESEEENEIEVVVEEDDPEQDSEDSDDEEDDEALESKVTELESKISENPYNYDEHIELIQALWRLSELDRWRSAFERLQQLSVLKPEHWLMRLQTEVTLGHSLNSREQIAQLFHQASIDGYSIQVFSEWCSWSISSGDTIEARAQIDEVLRRAGADPLSGKLFWDAKVELEKAQLEAMSASDPEYQTQQKRIAFCLEEAVSRPLLRGEEAMQQLMEIAEGLYDQDYIDKVKRQHEVAVEYLQKISPFEDKILTIEDPEEKSKFYQEYIELIKELSQNEDYAECDSDGILKVLYDRTTTECIASSIAQQMLTSFAKHAHLSSSRATYGRVLDACCRRMPRVAAFWIMKLHQAEHEEKKFDEIKAIFETALSKGFDTFKDAESLWLSYLEYTRRQTVFDNEQDVEKLRRTFRLAWDSLADCWGEEANDCEVPVFWARLEYRRLNDQQRGKEIFDEIFKYGENKTLSKYWETFIQLESRRNPPPSENKLRDLFKRALKNVWDYPPAVASLWIAHERDYGQLSSATECARLCEEKIKEWKDHYQAMKDKITGQKNKGKQSQNNKNNKNDKKNNKKGDKSKNNGKRKSDEHTGSDVKRKKEDVMDVEVIEQKADSANALKRSHGDDDEKQDMNNKRQRVESTSSDPRESVESRDACTLFVSNLEFKVNESNLKDKLSEYGEIVSMRVRSGVKAFGGSICYCQYKSQMSVDEALKHDRIPLDGRPMFLSRYSSQKGKQQFKYPTTQEKNKLFVKNLPYTHCTKEDLTKVFEKYGELKDIRIVTFKDGKPKGLAYVEYDNEKSANEALMKTNGMLLAERKLDVALSAPPPRTDSTVMSGAILGQPKREAGGGMRRTQLSSFIPRVLQKPSTSKQPTNGHQNGDEKRTLSNSDFRSLLLKQ